MVSPTTAPGVVEVQLVAPPVPLTVQVTVPVGAGLGPTPITVAV